MEASGLIDLGSAKKLAKEAKAAASHGQKSFRMLANALGPVVSMDSFVAKPSRNDEQDRNALEKNLYWFSAVMRNENSAPAAVQDQAIPQNIYIVGWDARTK